MTDVLDNFTDFNIYNLNEGSLYKNGYKLGKIFKNKINVTEYCMIKDKLYKKLKNKYNNLIFSLIQIRVKEWVNNLKNNFKMCIEDILGFSDALDIKDDTILELNILVEIYDYMCTLLGVVSKENCWNLRILDLDNELVDITKELNLPLSITINNISNNEKFIMIGFLGFFNAHTSLFNDIMLTTFSWNNMELKDFLKNKIPPLFHIKYSFLKNKSINHIHTYLKNSNILYDGYVMMMTKNKVILHDFNINRKESKETLDGHIVISDYKFEYNNDINYFIRNIYSTIPSKLRCFSVIYDFNNSNFHVNNNLKSKEFFSINLQDF